METVRSKTMETDKTYDEVLEHFGYDHDPTYGIDGAGGGIWKTENFFKNVGELQEFLLLNKCLEHKFRIVLDYDPEFVRGLFQYIPKD